MKFALFSTSFSTLLGASLFAGGLIPTLAPVAAFAQAPVAQAALKPAVTPAVTAKPAVAAVVPAPKPVKPQVTLSTTMGEIVLELEIERAPKTVENFLGYVKSEHYNGTVFHRVIKGFMVQGGGYTSSLSFKPVKAPIQNEANNGLSNLRGTVAMARLDDPHSADAQFFVNLIDNKFLNYTTPDSARGWGYTVFGKVIKGMDVVDKMANVAVENSMPGFEAKPVEFIMLQKATITTPAPVPVLPTAVAPAAPK